MSEPVPAPVITIDCEYVFPQFAASFLLREGNRALFVENNTTHSVPLLLKALADAGLKPEQVEYLIITHVHLDHAGGSHALMQACPNAQLLVHPRAARHVIDPSKLVSSAQHVYGKEKFEQLYGEIGPIDPARVREMADGEELRWGTRTLRFIYTRGHANHHFCVLDSGSGGIFTGDAFGLAYPALQRNGLFIFPSTSPTDFDPTEAKLSVARILSSGATHAYLTHFGEVADLQAAADQLLSHLDWSEELLQSAIASVEPDSGLVEYCKKRMFERFDHILAEKGLTDHRDLVEMDLNLNADGIAYVALKKRNQDRERK